MTNRYILAPQAAQDLVEIWFHILSHSGATVADRVEFVIREKIGFLSTAPGTGHWRKDLTSENVKFFPVYAYLIVYRPETTPLQIVSILHGRRDLQKILRTS